MPNIQKLKKERNINGLIKALNHKIWQIRCDAADALGDMNDSRAVEPLIAALEDERDSVPLNNCWVKMAAADALGQLGDARAVTPLIAALKNRGGLVITRGVATHLVESRDPRWVNVLTPLLESDSWVDLYSTVDKHAVIALGKIGDSRAVEPLIACLNDRSADMRRTVAEALGNLGNPQLNTDIQPGTRVTITNDILVDGNTEIGIVFDIDELGGGFYGLTAYKVLFQSLDPNRLKGCTLRDGDTAETLAGRARHYCIAFQSTDSATIQYVHDTLANAQEKGLLPAGRRFIEATSQQPLVLAGVIDSDGRLVVKEGSMIGPGWVEGTEWTVLTR